MANLTHLIYLKTAEALIDSIKLEGVNKEILSEASWRVSIVANEIKDALEKGGTDEESMS